MFTHAHLLDVEHITSVEDLEEDGRFSTEDHDLLVGDLVGQAHVGGNPGGLVDAWVAGNLLPNITLDIVDFDRVNDTFLVDSSSESKHIVVLEGTETNARTWHAHLC